MSAVQTATPVLSEGIVTPLKGIRRVAARRMVQAWEAPTFALGVDVDMTTVIAAAKPLPGVTVTDLLLRACARALTEVPGLNAHYADDAITTYPEVNIGLAVATPMGLMVPVIHGVQALSVEGIAERRRDLVARAREGKLVTSDVEGATFTVSNLGMLDIDRFTAIVNPPSVGILAVGSSKETVTVVDGSIAIRPMASMTLTCDHRAVDGALGATFLAALKSALRSPLEG